jgi:hypothetical protein
MRDSFVIPAKAGIQNKTASAEGGFMLFPHMAKMLPKSQTEQRSGFYLDSSPATPKYQEPNPKMSNAKKCETNPIPAVPLASRRLPHPQICETNPISTAADLWRTKNAKQTQFTVPPARPAPNYAKRTQSQHHRTGTACRAPITRNEPNYFSTSPLLHYSTSTPTIPNYAKRTQFSDPPPGHAPKIRNEPNLGLAPHYSPFTAHYSLFCKTNPIPPRPICETNPISTRPTTQTCKANPIYPTARLLPPRRTPKICETNPITSPLLIFSSSLLLYSTTPLLHFCPYHPPLCQTNPIPVRARHAVPLLRETNPIPTCPKKR